MLLLAFGLGGVIAPVVHQVGHPHISWMGTCAKKGGDGLRVDHVSVESSPVHCTLCQGIAALPIAAPSGVEPAGPSVRLQDLAPDRPLSNTTSKQRARAPPAVAV
jgi:hypothetical protein